jgi:hypothetical protein
MGVKVTVDKKDLEKSILDIPKLAENVGNDLVTFYKMHMRDGYDIHGDKFEDLKNGYRQKKGYKQYNYKVLIDSGSMWGKTRYEIDGNTLRIINDAEYSEYHNQGTDKLPKREFIGESPLTDKVVNESIENFIKNNTK